jgi:hypothetical protein
MKECFQCTLFKQRFNDQTTFVPTFEGMIIMIFIFLDNCAAFLVGQRKAVSCLYMYGPDHPSSDNGDFSLETCGFSSRI